MALSAVVAPLAQDPDAHLPALLEAVAPADDRGATAPSLQVAGLEHTAPDAHPAARQPPLRARVEAAAGDPFDLPEVQVEAMADAAKPASEQNDELGKGQQTVEKTLMDPAGIDRALALAEAELIDDGATRRRAPLVVELAESTTHASSLVPLQ